MSFLSILKNIAHGLVVVDVAAAPIVTTFNPPIGNAMNVIGQLVLKAEATMPAAATGAAKKAFVQQGVDAILPQLQDTPAKKAAVSKIIDTTVAQLNAAKDLQVAADPIAAKPTA